LGRVPFLYLGLSIGGDPRKLKFWQPLINRIKSRLSGWKSKNLSLGGRLVLLKSVLSSLPVYFLSFFKAPAGIISSIESIFNCFFFWGCEEVRKISWFNWDTICSKKEDGGLGVRRIREFNLALLGKWCWRMRVENRSLWYRVLTGRYGEVGGIIVEEGQFNSIWWNNLININNGVGVGGGWWFDDNVGRKVGDGAHTLFWWDPWIDELVLKNSFGRLFDLANNKMTMVAEIYSLGWWEEGEAWKWRRRLFTWEEKVRGCCDILTNIVLQPNHSDRWIWHLHASSNYNVTSAYNHLLTPTNNNLSATHTSEI